VKPGLYPRRPQERDPEFSLRLAKAGDWDFLKARFLGETLLSDEERALVVEALPKTRRRAGRPPRRDALLPPEDAGTVVCLYLRVNGGKVEAAIAEAMEAFGLSRSAVYAARRAVASDPVKAARVERLAEAIKVYELSQSSVCAAASDPVEVARVERLAEKVATLGESTK
jgi:hypothetical protein